MAARQGTILMGEGSEEDSDDNVSESSQDEVPQARAATGTVLAGEDDEEDSTSEDDDTVATASTAANTGGGGVDQDIDGAAPNRQGLDLMTAALKNKLAPVLTMLSARLVELQQRQVSVLESIAEDRAAVRSVLEQPVLASITARCAEYQAKIARIRQVMQGCTTQAAALAHDTQAMHAIMKAGEEAVMAERRRSKQLDMDLAAKPSLSLQAKQQQQAQPSGGAARGSSSGDADSAGDAGAAPS